MFSRVNRISTQFFVFQIVFSEIKIIFLKNLHVTNIAQSNSFFVVKKAKMKFIVIV